MAHTPAHLKRIRELRQVISNVNAPPKVEPVTPKTSPPIHTVEKSVKKTASPALLLQQAVFAPKGLATQLKALPSRLQTAKDEIDRQANFKAAVADRVEPQVNLLPEWMRAYAIEKGFFTMDTGSQRGPKGELLTTEGVVADPPLEWADAGFFLAGYDPKVGGGTLISLSEVNQRNNPDFKPLNKGAPIIPWLDGLVESAYKGDLELFSSTELWMKAIGVLGEETDLYDTETGNLAQPFEVRNKAGDVETIEPAEGDRFIKIPRINEDFKFDVKNSPGFGQFVDTLAAGRSSNDLALVLAGASTGGIGFLASLASTTVGKDAIGEFRREIEEKYIVPKFEGLLHSLDVPLVDIPFSEEAATLAAELARPSVLVEIGAATYLTRRYLPKAILARTSGRLATEGALWGVMEAHAEAWSQQRNPTVEEIMMTLGAGAGGAAALGVGLPLLMKAAGGRFVRMPAGYLAEGITAQTYGRLPPGVKGSLKRYFSTTSTSVLKTLKASSRFGGRISPEKIGEVLTRNKLLLRVSGKKGAIPEKAITTQEAYYVHGTAADASIAIRQEGLKAGEAVYVTTNVDKARVFAQNTAAIENVPLGDVLLLKADPGQSLLVQGSKQWDDIISGMSKADRVDDKLINAAVEKAGYDGLYTAGTKGSIGDQIVFFDPKKIQYDALLVNDNPQAAKDLATTIFEGKRVTSPEVAVSPEQVLIELRLMAGKTLPKDAREALDEMVQMVASGLGKEQQAAVRKALLEGGLTTSGRAQMFNRLSDLIPEQEFRELIKYVTGNSVERQVMGLALAKSMQKPLPQSVFNRWQNTIRATGTLSPAQAWRTLPQLEAAAAMFEFEGVGVNARLSLISKLLSNTFPGMKNFGREEQRAVFERMGLKYVGPELGAGGKTVGNTIPHLLEHPELYRGMNANLRTFVQVWTELFDQDLVKAINMGVPVEHINMAYFAHVVEDANKPAVNVMRAALGSRQSIPSGRTHQFIEQYADALAKGGFEVEVNPLIVATQRLMAGSNARKNMAYMRGVAENYGRFDKSPSSRARIGEVELPISRNSKDGRWYVTEEMGREVDNITRPKVGDYDVLGVAERVVDMMRGTLLSWDLSAFSIQGLRMMSTDPARFLAKAGDVITKGSTREGYMVWMTQNAEDLALYTAGGGSLYNSAIDLGARLGEGTFSVDAAGKLGKSITTMSPLTDWQYGRVLPMLKLTAFQSYRDTLLALRDQARIQRTLLKVPGLSIKTAKMIGEPLDSFVEGIPGISAALRKFGGVDKIKTEWDVVRVAADAASNVGGGMNYASIGREPGLLQKGLLLTPGWLRANVGLLVNAGKIGSPKGVLARRILMHHLAISSMIATVLSQRLSGRNPSYNPTATDFLDIKTPEGSIAFLPEKSYLRTIARVAFGTPWDDPEVSSRINETLRFIGYRRGQVAGVGVDLWTGRDIFGRKIENRFNHTWQSMLPIVGQEIVSAIQEDSNTRQFIERVSAQITGLNYVPVSTVNRINKDLESSATWRESGEIFTDADGTPITDVFDMSADQMREYRLYDNSDAGSHLLDRWDAEQAARDNIGPEFRAVAEWKSVAIAEAGKLLQEESGITESRALYRNRVTSIKTIGRISSALIFASSGIEDREGRTIDQTVMNGYMEEVIDASLDPTLRAQLAELIAKGGEAEAMSLLALSIDSDMIELNESNYFNFVTSEYGDEALIRLKANLVANNPDDTVFQEYQRARDRLDVGYYRVIDDLFQPKYLKQTGLPESIADEFRSWPSYKEAAIRSLASDLTGRILDPSMGNLKGADGRTYYETFGINPTRPLNQAQAEQMSKKLTSKFLFKEYDALLTKVKNVYLQDHNAQLCDLWFWEYRDTFNNDLKPFLATCSAPVSSQALAGT